MKKFLCLLMFITISSLQAFANGPFGYPTFETTDQARAQHSAENYETYKNNNYNPPLGGYSSGKLGDPQPQGTLKPGYINNGLNSNYNHNQGLNHW